MDKKSREIEKLISRLGRVDFDAFPAVAPFEGAEVSCCYSRSEAIEEGALIDVSEADVLFEDIEQIAVTPGVMSEIIDDHKWMLWGTEKERLKVVLNRAADALEKSSDSVAFFSIEMIADGEVHGTISLKAQRSFGDNLEPVLTVKLSHED